MAEWKRDGFSNRNFSELKIEFNINFSCKNFKLENLRKALPFPEATKKGYEFHYTKISKTSVNKKYQKYSQKTNYKVGKILQWEVYYKGLIYFKYKKLLQIIKIDKIPELVCRKERKEIKYEIFGLLPNPVKAI